MRACVNSVMCWWLPWFPECIDIFFVNLYRKKNFNNKCSVLALTEWRTRRNGAADSLQIYLWVRVKCIEDKLVWMEVLTLANVNGSIGGGVGGVVTISGSHQTNKKKHTRWPRHCLVYRKFRICGSTLESDWWTSKRANDKYKSQQHLELQRKIITTSHSLRDSYEITFSGFKEKQNKKNYSTSVL